MITPTAQVNSLREMFVVCFVGSLCVAVYITALLYLGGTNCTSECSQFCFPDKSFCPGALLGSSGSIGGAFTTAGSKIWSIFNAFGLLFFRYDACNMSPHPSAKSVSPPCVDSFSVSSVLMEIVDTIAEKPVQNGQKAFSAAYAMVAAILFSIAIVTYGSVGDSAPNWFLDAFTAPAWVIITANLVRPLHT